MSSLTYGQLADIAAGLSGLDGLQTKDGAVVFKYDAETTWLIAKNTHDAAQAMRVYETAKKALAKQHGIQDRMQVTKDNSAQVAAFLEGLDVLNSKEAEVDLQPIPRDSLKLSANAIPPGVLAKLMPILE